jgi:mono/diheme cytochrome c family protein
MRRLVLALAIGAATLVAALFISIQVRWRRTFDAPLPALRASTDSAVIARGKYLAYGPATCAYCHVPKSEWPRLDAGEMPELAGNHVFVVPFGTIYSANLTPDDETGIGRRTDAELARILRHGVRADGRAAMPFMEYQQMSDEDLVAVLSFLRAQPPVRNPVPEHELNLLGRVLMAFLIRPVGPASAPAAGSPVEAPTVERGSYLANSLSGCAGCHTERDMRSGAFTGPPFAGGSRMDIADDPDHVFVTPNLTRDVETGVMAQWSEDAFVARFRQGATVEGTIMPWGAYARMSDDDLRAVYRYLRSLPPVRNVTGPVYQDREPGG